MLVGLLLAVNAPAQVNPGSTPEPPPAVPPKSLAIGQWNMRYQTQDIEGHVYKLRGSPGAPAEIENSSLIFRADEIDFDQDSGDVRASGHVFFHNFDRNMKMWCDHLTYNTDEETGKFYDVIGETRPKVVAKPGMLTTNNPFHFEGQWAERIGEKYILHSGFITNCKTPQPWWRLRGKSFDIIPDDRAIAHKSTFLVRNMPLFFTPFFYHSLEKEPRHSGFLLPLMGHSSRRGWMVHAGYFWAINRSYDLTYRAQYYTTRGLVHHVDFRGKPRPGTDYDVIMTGVQDKGVPNSGNPPQKFSGVSLLAVGQSDLGNGWTARANINYITSFRFRQEWSESYSDIVGSEIHSVGFINKNWSNYTVNVIFARLQNFQSSEINTAPADQPPNYVANAVTIRKLPEVEFTSRFRQIFNPLPLFFSFESSAGLLFRSEPVFNADNTILVDKFQTGQFMNRTSFSPRLTGMFSLGAIHLVPSFGIQEMYYGESQEPYMNQFQVVGTNIVRSSRDFSLDVMLPSLARVFNKKTIFGDKLKHVIEPRVTYRYVTGIGDDFLRFIRFDENDLASNTNELLISIANRVYAKRGDKVEEIFTWELSQKRYLRPHLRRCADPRRAQRDRPHRGPHGLCLSGGTTQHLAGGQQPAHEPDRRPGRALDGRLRSARRWHRRQQCRRGLPLCALLPVRRTRYVAHRLGALRRRQPVPRARRLRRSQSQGLQRRRRSHLRLPSGRDPVHHLPGHVQHQLLRTERPIPPLQCRFHRRRAQRIPCSLRRGQHLHPARQSQEQDRMF